VGLIYKVRRRLAWYRRMLDLSWKWLAYETRQTRPWCWPDRMYLESTNVCNLSCIMCPNGTGRMRRKKGFMDFELFKAIVDEMAPHVRATTLHIWGEPLLHPRIFDMIRYCHQKGLRNEISTNATLLDEERSRLLLEAGLDALYIGMDGATEETYERIRRRSDYSRTVANIRRFLQLKVEGGYSKPWVNLQIIEMRPTLGEIEKFRRLWSVPGVNRVHIKPFDSWGGQVEEINVLRADQPQLPKRRFPCPNLWYHVHIYWDGTLVCCDRDFDALYPLGNVSGGVMRAWRGERMALLRRKHILNQLEDVPSCRDCVEWAWWKPTPFTASGNIPQRR